MRVFLEGFTGLAPDDYPDRPEAITQPSKPAERTIVVRRLRQKLQTCLRRAKLDSICRFLICLANCCSHNNQERGTLAGLAVMETYFDLSPGNYTSAHLLERLGPLVKPEPTDSTAVFLGALATYLDGVGRAEEARQLVYWFLGLTPCDLASPEILIARAKGRLARLNPNLTAPLRHVIPQVLHSVLTPTLNLQLVECLLDITSEVYQQPAVLVQRLGWDRNEIRTIPEVALSNVFGLLEALDFARQHDRALAVLRGLLHEPGEEPSNAAGLCARIPAFVATLPLHGQSIFYKPVLTTFFRLGWLQPAAALAEQWLGLTPDIYRQGPVAVAAQLGAAPLGFSPEDRMFILGGLWGSLVDNPSREYCAKTLLEAILWDFLALNELAASNPAHVMGTCVMLENWLQHTPPAKAYTRCGQIVACLRTWLDLRGLTLADRARFVKDIGTLRRQIIQIGYQQTLSDNRLGIDVLCWDVELGQRLLYERYRFAGTDGAELSINTTAAGTKLRDGWSLDEKCPPFEGYLRAKNSFPIGEPRGRYGVLPAGYRPPVALDESDRVASPTGRLAQVENVVRQGVDAATLAAALGPGDILLRAGFTEAGCLFWLAFAVEGGAVRLLAHGNSADDTARADIRQAVAWHDTVLEALWAECNRDDGPLHDASRDLAPAVEEFVRALAVRRGSAPLSPEEFAQRQAQLLERCNRHAAGACLAPWLRAAVRPHGHLTLNQEVGLRERWRLFAEFLQAVAGGRFEQCIDEATRVFLHWSQRHWDLASLLPHLGPDTDLVVEVEDALHAIPVAFLPTEGWLFEHVRSVRANLSVLLTLLRDAEPLSAEEGPPALVTVSWFAPDDPALMAVRAGEWWLHVGQGYLAQREGLPWRTAARLPAGSAAALRTELRAGKRVRLLTVCGHGVIDAGSAKREYAATVQLSDAAWNGDGGEFGQVDWLILVSCSVGRLLQDADGPALPDVEGFVANLVARRTPAALACRWPVHTLQAPWFANAVADEYLVAGKQTGRADRAAALARARRRFLGGRVDRAGVIGLNTLAAFELYGAG